MRQLIIIRHGKAAHNLGSEKAHTFAGSQIDDELSDAGKENAEYLSGEIAKLGKINAIITSDLKRSKQTAEIIKNNLDDDIPVYNFPEIQEINIGEFAGHTQEEVEELFSEQAAAFYSGDITNWNFPHGENFDQVSLRLDKALVKIKEITNDNAKIVLSGHGMINRVLFYKLAPGNVALWKERSYPHGRIDIINM